MLAWRSFKFMLRCFYHYLLHLFLSFCRYHYTLYMCAVVLARTDGKTRPLLKIFILDSSWVGAEWKINSSLLHSTLVKKGSINVILSLSPPTLSLSPLSLSLSLFQQLLPELWIMKPSKARTVVSKICWRLQVPCMSLFLCTCCSETEKYFMNQEEKNHKTKEDPPIFAVKSPHRKQRLMKSIKKKLK